MVRNNNMQKDIDDDNLKYSVFAGMVAGIFGIIAFGIFLNNLGWNFICFSFILAAACYISGFFLGILFGIPKRQNNDTGADYSLNNNLADISDWLTKIIIGLGLIELKKIPGYLGAAGDYVMNTIDKKQPSIKLFAICCIIYFIIFGLYYGYCYMRLYLSGQIKDADDDLLERKKEELAKENITPSATENFNDETKKKFSDYNEQLISSKKEEEYTLEDWFYKGINNYNHQEYEKTIACMKNALAKDAKNRTLEAEALNYLGISYANLGLHEKSIEEYKKIVTNYSDHPNLYSIYLRAIQELDILKQFKEADEMKNQASAYLSKTSSLKK